MSMRPYGGFIFTFENETQASEAYPIIKKETAKTMAVWGEAVKQDGGMVTVDMKTDLGDEYNEETEQMVYRDGIETLLNVCKALVKADSDISFQMEGAITDDEGGFYAREKASKDENGFSYRRSVEVSGPDYDDLEEFDADEDIDLDEEDPDGTSTLKSVLIVNGSLKDGKWSFKKKQKTTLDLDE